MTQPTRPAHRTNSFPKAAGHAEFVILKSSSSRIYADQNMHVLSWNLGHINRKGPADNDISAQPCAGVNCMKLLESSVCYQNINSIK